MAEDRKNEGEGSRTAARRYNEAQREFADTGQVEEKAKEAKKAREGSERNELERAEQVGKEHAKEEDPSLKRDYSKEK